MAQFGPSYGVSPALLTIPAEEQYTDGTRPASRSRTAFS